MRARHTQPLAFVWLCARYDAPDQRLRTRFGPRQVWLHLRGFGGLAASLRHAVSRSSGVKGIVIWNGWSPLGGADHDGDEPLFVVMTSADILVAIQFEEHVLVIAHPEDAARRRGVSDDRPESGEARSGGRPAPCVFRACS